MKRYRVHEERAETTYRQWSVEADSPRDAITRVKDGHEKVALRREEVLDAETPHYEVEELKMGG